MSTETNTPLLTVEALPEYEPTVGRWLWQLADTRRETLDALKNISPTALDWTPFPGENSIGTLLYHIALIELDWLFTEVLEQKPWPQEIKEAFSISDRDTEGHLNIMRETSLEEHLQRLNLIREYLLASFRDMTLQEFRRPRVLPEYQVTAEWVIHHLIQHEAEHRGHIQLLRSLAEHALEAK